MSDDVLALRSRANAGRVLQRAAKLLDFLPRLEELERSKNPFAFLIAAFLRSRESAEPEDRLHWKLDFARRVLRIRRGRSILEFLFRMLDNLIDLEGDMKRRYDETMVSQDVDFASLDIWTDMEREAIRRGLKQGVEEGVRRGVKRGVRQGVRQGVKQGVRQGVKQGVKQGKSLGRIEGSREVLVRVLRARFRRVPRTLQQRIRRIANPRVLDRLAESAACAVTLDAFARGLPPNKKPAGAVERGGSKRSAKIARA